MRYKVQLPSLGDEEDAVTGGKISCWLADVGNVLDTGDDLLELTTDKAAFVVPSPRAGTLMEQCVRAGDEVQVGDLLAVLDADDA